MNTNSKNVEMVIIKSRSNQTYAEMWNRRDLSDVTLYCGPEKFHVHRSLLVACSPYFRYLFTKRTDENLKIGFEEVDSDVLRQVLKYMYDGSVAIKAEDVQDFIELLNMFMMRLSDDITVNIPEPTRRNDDIDIGDFVGFTENVRLELEHLTESNLAEISINLLNLTEAEENVDGVTSSVMSKWDALLDMILQPLFMITPNSLNMLVFPLFNQICIQLGKKKCPEHEYRECIRKKSLNLLWSILYKEDEDQKRKEPLDLVIYQKTLHAFAQSHDETIFQNQFNHFDQPTDPALSPTQLKPFDSFDLQTHKIELIQYHCGMLRKRRLAHFIGHLYAIKLIRLVDIYDIRQQQSNESISKEILGGAHNTKNCCVFELPEAVQQILHDDCYQRLLAVEDQMYFSQIKAIPFNRNKPNPTDDFIHLGRDGVFAKKSRRRNRKPS